MNEYDGVITKPELTDEAFSDCGIIEHGWLKDAASKVHKYVDRWRGKGGKWYYSYKSKNLEKKAKKLRDEQGYSDTDETLYIKKSKVPSLLYGRSVVTSKGRAGDNGRANSRNYTSGRAGSKIVKTTKVGPTREQRRQKYMTNFNNLQIEKAARRRKTQESMKTLRERQANEERSKQFRKELEDTKKRFAQEREEFEKEWNKRRKK